MTRISREAAKAMGIPVPPPIMATADYVKDNEPPSQLAASRGRAAQKLGEEYEALLEHTHQVWATWDGLEGGLVYASIRKLPVETGPAPRRIKDPERKISPGTIRVLKTRQGYDYMGSVFTGQAVALEAKATSSRQSSIRISVDQGVREHQLRSLATEIKGCKILGAVLWNNGGDRLILEPAAVVKAWERYEAGGRKSIPASEFTPYEVDGGLEDYMHILLETDQ